MFKTSFWLLLAVGAAGLAAASPAFQSLYGIAPAKYEVAAVGRGTIVKVVRATGRVKPVHAVQVGTFVSGPIDELFVDFNDTVKKGDLLAKIDARIYESEVAQDRAIVATRKADLQRVKALLEQAVNEEQRGLGVREDNEDFISDSELDALKYQRLSLAAQVEVSKAAVQQAEAKLKNSLANLEYTEIRSPVDGVVIDRRVEKGQTVAATFATPVLFIVAPELAQEMHVYATVDEADIGLVRAAKQEDRTVSYTVDAYPDEVFEGRIEQIRSSSAAIDGVVTFPVVVSTTNPDRKLMGGMTANLLFKTEQKDEALYVPNSAIRFYPPEHLVRQQDRSILDPEQALASEAADDSGDGPSLLHNENRNRRHVWVANDEGKLRAVEITIGISDDRVTEVLKGELTEGDKIVIAVES